MLVPATGVVQGGSTPQFSLDRDNLAGGLKDYLGRIRPRRKSPVSLLRAGRRARAKGAPAAARSDPGARIQFEVIMVKLHDKTDRKGEPVSWKGHGITLGAGDWIAFRVTNKGKAAADISLLFVDSHFGIQAVFPRPGTTTDNRLAPGDSYQTPAARVNPRTTGQEHMVVIAVEANGPPIDFSCLAQPRIEQAEAARTRGGEGKDMLETPLGGLFKSALYGRGTTRGLDVDAVENYALRLLSWQVLPAKP